MDGWHKLQHAYRQFRYALHLSMSSPLFYLYIYLHLVRYNYSYFINYLNIRVTFRYGIRRPAMDDSLSKVDLGYPTLTSAFFFTVFLFLPLSPRTPPSSCYYFDYCIHISCKGREITRSGNNLAAFSPKSGLINPGGPRSSEWDQFLQRLAAPQKLIGSPLYFLSLLLSTISHLSYSWYPSLLYLFVSSRKQSLLGQRLHDSLPLWLDDFREKYVQTLHYYHNLFFILILFHLLSCFAFFYSILFYSVLFYFILFHFILFCLAFLLQCSLLARQITSA